ncbi:hypothetical protein [Dethiothermospora halolimnae]|uniref:hypothetical protein n=1 Tax=Dethiothermospora halolimnae TaxID=3114390 RepID=UPI003CCBBF20
MIKDSKKYVYILLGIGIGLIIGGSVALLSPKVKYKYKEYTDEEILKRATEIKLDKIKNKDTDSSKKKDNKVKDNIVKDEEDNKENKMIKFIIEEGEKSQDIINNLYNKEIIDDKEQFRDIMIKENAEKSFIYGIYNIEEGLSNEEVLKILTNKKKN